MERLEAGQPTRRKPKPSRLVETHDRRGPANIAVQSIRGHGRNDQRRWQKP